jgi:beta-galactosidase
MGYYDFGNGTFDMSAFLNLTRWIQMAEEEDLLVIFRPGPYICSEWEFGGERSYIFQPLNRSTSTMHVVSI